MDSRRFTVALSFPGEYREYVSKVADLLAEKLSKPKILYDKYHEAEFARPNLDVHLPNLYRTESELIAIFLCDEYKKKRWCKLEWRFIRQLISTAEEDRIMFLSFDEVGAIPEIGILDGDGYVSIGKRSSADIADLILQRLSPQLEQKKERSSRPTADLVIAPTRLHHGADHLFGRDEELAGLDQIASDPSKKLLTIVAFGGVGKTSLVIEWMARQAANNWNGFERVFDWSFFSQGTREQGAASAEGFIAEALRFFGDTTMAQSAASAWDKGARLAQLVAQRRTLLVLDGVEPLQYPPGPLAGELKDPALATLLKGLARSNSGLCIVTTRERVADLSPFRDTTAPEWQLHHLSIPAGVEFLKTLGVRGTAVEFHQLVERVKGHALTLNLLGRYLARAHGGDIRKSDQVKFEKADAATQGGYAFKTIGAYERWLNEGGKDGVRQLAVLRLLGLFDRPADAGCIKALRSEPVIADLTEPLVGLDEVDWNLAVSALEECGLVSRAGQLETPNSKLETALDAHPLIREYFAKQLREKKPESWRGAHRRLYEYLRDTTTEGDQPTLEDLQPLYQAVAHGCQAGLQQEALYEVYFARIVRRNEKYTARKLGAFSSNLGAIASFFETPWNRVLSQFSEVTQALLFDEAGFALSALGRLAEAIEPSGAAMELAASMEDWPNATSGASNLSELDLVLGEVAWALEAAEQSVTYAEKSEDSFFAIHAGVRLGNALHQAGRRADALLRIRAAETMQAKQQPDYPVLYSHSGFQYCDLLLTEAEREAGQEAFRTDDSVKRARPESDMAPYLESCLAVSARADKMFEWRLPGDPLLDIGLDHLTLGRAALYSAIMEGRNSIPMARSGFRERDAATTLDAAVAGLRRAGTQHQIPQGLLTRAWLRTVEGDADGAHADLDEAWEIAERGPMRLYMADIHLYRARLFHAVKPYPWNKNPDGTERGPKHDLAAARKLIESCGYWRRKEELEDAEAAAKNW